MVAEHEAGRPADPGHLVGEQRGQAIAPLQGLARLYGGLAGAPGRALTEGVGEARRLVDERPVEVAEAVGAGARQRR